MAAPPEGSLGRPLLHGVAHAPSAEPSGGFQMAYLAGSVIVVGLLGGLLYWYYGRRVGTR